MLLIAMWEVTRADRAKFSRQRPANAIRRKIATHRHENTLLLLFCARCILPKTNQIIFSTSQMAPDQRGYIVGPEAPG